MQKQKKCSSSERVTRDHDATNFSVFAFSETHCKLGFSSHDHVSGVAKDCSTCDEPQHTGVDHCTHSRVLHIPSEHHYICHWSTSTAQTYISSLLQQSYYNLWECTESLCLVNFYCCLFSSSYVCQFLQRTTCDLCLKTQYIYTSLPLDYLEPLLCAHSS